MSSNWKIITPEATTNLITNPSFEPGTTGWATGGTNTIAQSSDYSHYGIYSLKATYQDNIGLAYWAATLTAAAYAGSLWVYIPSSWSGSSLTLGFTDFAGSTAVTGSADMTKTDQWQLVTATVTPVAGDLSGNFKIYGTATAGDYIYIDGAQIEAKSYATTYCDGDQPGCKWLGTRNASTSTRDALDARGGRVLDFADDLNFIIAEQDGTGMPPVNNLYSPLALQPGNIFDDQTIDSRSFKLIGSIVGETPEDFHEKRKLLISALNPQTVRINQRAQPRTLRYEGAGDKKEIFAVYDGGLEFGLQLGWAKSNAAVRFRADDPLFYQVGETGVSGIDTTDSDVFYYLARRTGDNPLWDAMGGGGTGAVNTIAEDDDYIYIGGAFLNWEAIANADYIARYKKETGTWSALGTGLNGSCRKLLIGSDGEIYACGDFTTAGGGAANRIAVWNGSAWSALGTGFNNSAADMAFAPDGTLYVCGDFTTAGGSTANYVARWALSTWFAVGSGPGNVCYAIAIDQQNNIYVGTLTTGGIKVWNGSAWAVVGGGFNAPCLAIDIASDGRVYAGGSFTTYSYIAVWNGSAWSNLGTGLNGACRTIYASDDGKIYVGGDFSTAGDSSGTDGAAVWSGSSWVHTDINLPGSPNVKYFFASIDGTLYIGFGNSGTAGFSGITTIDYDGTERAYPTIIISRSGGTYAILRNITNETTGARLYFDYSLLDGERITIDTRPSQQKITSSIFGDIYGTLFPSSDFGNFYIMPGNSGTMTNVFSFFVRSDATVNANMTYKKTYISED